jgi:hypothetical protein
MPPLAILIGGGLTVLLILARTCAPARCKLYSEHPSFIADIVHGICPRCGSRAHVEEAD